MHAAKVEVALGRHVGDVGGDAPLLAQLVDLRRGRRVVDGREHQVGVVEIAWLEGAVDVGHLLLCDAVGDFIVEAGTRRDDGDFGVGVEDVVDAAGCDLDGLRGQCQYSGRCCR